MYLWGGVFCFTFLYVVRETYLSWHVDAQWGPEIYEMWDVGCGMYTSWNVDVQSAMQIYRTCRMWNVGCTHDGLYMCHM